MAPKSVQDLKKYAQALSKHWTLAINLRTFKRPSQLRFTRTPLLISLFLLTSLSLIESAALAENDKKNSSDQFKNPLYRESLALIEARDYQSAVKSLSLFLDGNPSSDEGYFLRGKAYHELGTLDKATADYIKAIELNPSSHKAFNNRGLIYGQRKQFDLATKSFTKAINNNPQAKEAFNNRGVAKAASGDPNGAIIDFTSSIKIDKTYLEPVLNRSFVLEMQGKLDQACEDWKTASQLGSRDAQIWLKAQCKI